MKIAPIILITVLLHGTGKVVAQKLGNEYPSKPLVVGEITLYVSHGNWIAEDRQSRHELSRAPISEYINLAGVEEFTRNGRHFIIWTGCYPHRCDIEFGALVFDYELQRFYRFHAIDNSYDSLFVDSKFIPRDQKRYVQLIGNPPQEIIQKLLLQGDVQISGEMCSALYCDDAVFGPQSSQRFKDEIAEENRVSNRILLPLGLSVGQKYTKARKILLSLGWKPFVDEGD